jgi:allophanate hydrolase
MELCGTAVPCGFRSDGLALGITIIAPPFADAKAASIAAAFQRALDLPLGGTSARLPPQGGREALKRSVTTKRAQGA